jgi:hypothetical protein
MTSLITCLLTLFFSLSSPAMEGNAGFGQSSLTAEEGQMLFRGVPGNGTIIEVDLSKVSNQVVPRPNVPKYGGENEVLLRGTVQGRPTRP